MKRLLLILFLLSMLTTACNDNIIPSIVASIAGKELRQKDGCNNEPLRDWNHDTRPRDPPSHPPLAIARCLCCKYRFQQEMQAGGKNWALHQT